MPLQNRPNKKIAFVSSNAWSVYNFRIDVVRSLLTDGYEVIVFAGRDDFSTKLVEAGCTFIPIAFNNKGQDPIKDFLFYQLLRRLYQQHRPDFIFHYIAKPNIYGSMAAAALNIPCVAVITGLGYAFDKRNMLFYIIKRLYKHALKRTQEVWFLNNEDAKIFTREKIISIGKIKILPGEGINTEHFAPMPKVVESRTAFRFLMSSRLLKSKGIGIYADAARILRKKNLRHEFKLIGFYEPDHPDAITPEQVDNWEKEGLIRYQGFSDDVRSHMAEADCFVFPSSYNEGVPRTLMEASSMQIPVITTINRGCREVVINNVSGYLCNMNDPFDLADKMEKMTSLSVDERRLMGLKGRELVIKKFGMSKIIQEYSNTLISAFESNHGSNS